MASTPTAPATADGVSSTQYAQRFGALLRRHRRRRPMELRRLAARSRRAGHDLSPRDLLAHERGQRPLDPQAVERLCDLYGVPFESALPDHRAVVVDLERRELRVGGVTYAMPDSDDPAPHLERYVRVVNRLRSQPMRNPATLRRDDAEALAEALQLDADDVTDLLAEAIGQEAAIRRRAYLLRSGTGTLATVVVIGAGASALDVRADERSPESETVVLAAAEVAGSAPAGGSEPAAGSEPAGGSEPVAVPPSEAVAGPDLVPSASLPPAPERGGSEPPAAGAGGPEFEDETNVDAPGGPVTIEREDYDAEQEQGDAEKAGGSEQARDDHQRGETESEDETVIDAEGGPVMMDRDEYEAQKNEGDGDGDGTGG